ncbi:MAG: hypothetical protein ACE5K2_09000 [Candidatus Zixiibacteriota bacterium]
MRHILKEFLLENSLFRSHPPNPHQHWMEAYGSKKKMQKNKEGDKKVFRPKWDISQLKPAPTLERSLWQSYAKMSPPHNQSRANTDRKLMAVKEDGIFCFTNMRPFGI